MWVPIDLVGVVWVYIVGIAFGVLSLYFRDVLVCCGFMWNLGGLGFGVAFAFVL